MQNAGEPTNDLDKAFRPSRQLSTMDGAEDKNTGCLMEGDGEFIEHDEAHSVFRSPRPSVTLQELQERESRKQSCHDNAEGASRSPSAMRGGVFGGNPLHDLWLAQEMDVGGDPCLLAGSATLDPKAYETSDKTAMGEYKETSWKDEDVFSDSETEDVIFDDSEMEDAEEASSDDGRDSKERATIIFVKPRLW